ncbi:hypothetical protein Ahy_B07g087025 [Arachis hypogaea]|uniref:SWIM-type domain-containing protein n=1 Tax=Arachis hypogaea TaxID=3818 RepID=A0A444YB58_ARAHY|nr:hypothetical protein Ahy_B07g087025 [Arachis hypogaea]
MAEQVIELSAELVMLVAVDLASQTLYRMTHFTHHHRYTLLVQWKTWTLTVRTPTRSTLWIVMRAVLLKMMVSRSLYQRPRSSHHVGIFCLSRTQFRPCHLYPVTIIHWIWMRCKRKIHFPTRVRRVGGVHTCLAPTMSQEHRQLDSSLICCVILLLIQSTLSKNREKISKMCITHCDRRASVFPVEDLEPFEGWSQGSYRVRLTVGTCDCDLFQSLHFSCRHPLVACATTNVKWGSYVHPVYMQHVVFKVYEADSLLIPDKKLWPEWYGTQLCPNPAMHRKSTGRLVFTRFRNEMDEGEHQEKMCGLYRKTSHIRKSCPNQPMDED